MATTRTAGARTFEKLQDIYRAVDKSPGTYKRDVAMKLDVLPGTLYRRLASMDLAGLLLYEGGNGILYPFRVIDRKDAEILYSQTRR